MTAPSYGRVVRDTNAGPRWPYRRQLSTIEAKSKVDPLALDAEVSQIMGDLMQQWPKITGAWAKQLAEQIGAALDSGDPQQLLSFAVDSGAAGDQLAAAMLAAAEVGAATATDEADAQGVALGDGTVDEDTLTSKAHTLAGLMGAAFAASAAREGLRLWDTARSSADVTDDVLNHLGSLSDSPTRDLLGGAVNGGVNDGRQAAMATADTSVTFYASEVRDANCCEACVEIDGTEFANQEEADASYPTGGYIDCYGRYRCRGIVIAVYGDTEEES